MDIDDKKEVKEESLTPRLTLVHGGSRVVMPHRATKLELRVNPTWQLFEAMEANDRERVFASLARGADANLCPT